MMWAMRSHPKHRDDADDDDAHDAFDRGIAAQLAQHILRGKRARTLRKPGREMKSIDRSNRNHAKKEDDLRQQKATVIGISQCKNAAHEIPGINRTRH